METKYTFNNLEELRQSILERFEDGTVFTGLNTGDTIELAMTHDNAYNDHTGNMVLSADTYDALTIANIIVDWVSYKRETAGYYKLSEFYTTREIEFYFPNRPLSELGQKVIADYKAGVSYTPLGSCVCDGIESGDLYRPE